MVQQQFQFLCSEVARVLSLEDTEAIFNGHDVRLDGVKIGLLHDESADPAGVHCYVDFGQLPDNLGSNALAETLLDLNLQLDARFAEGFGLESESRHIILRARLPGDGLDGQQVARRLHYYAALANKLYGGVLSDVERPEL